MNPTVLNPGALNPGALNPGVLNPGVLNPGVLNPGDELRRRGVTLLEVLIACGLLVVGLSTMAALLPAAGSRFAQASLEDRAGGLSANAVAEIFNRGLVAADAFPAASAAEPEGDRTSRTLTFGCLLDQLPAYGKLPNGGEAQTYFTGLSDAGRQRCGSPRTFLLDDEVTYTPPKYFDSPVNEFFTMKDGGAGPRQFRRGVCWGAMVAADEFPPRAGGGAVLSVAVFKKDGGLGSEQMEEGLAVVLQRRTSYYEADITPVGTLLRPCTWLLAVPPSSDRSPKWFQVISSWTRETAASTGSSTRLILKQQEDFEAFTGTSATGSSAIVFAFEGLVRVDEHPVTLE